MAGMFARAWNIAHVETLPHGAYKIYSNDIILIIQDLRVT